MGHSWRLGLRLLTLTLALILGTSGFGWWMVPLVASAWGIVGAGRERPALVVTLAAGLAWGSLLVWSAVVGPAGMLAGKLGGVMGVPPPAFAVATIVLPMLLAWSAATLSRVARR